MNDNCQTSAYGQEKLSFIDRLTIHKRLEIARKVISEYQTEKHKNKLQILEVGCGFQGLNLVRLSQSFSEALFTGVDVRVAALSHPQVRLIEGNITQWQPKRQYDIVLSLAVIEHLINPIQHFALIRQCLKSDGIALMTTPTPPNHFIWGNLARLGMIDADGEEEHKLYLTRGGIFRTAESQSLVVADYHQFEWGLNQYAILIPK